MRDDLQELVDRVSAVLGAPATLEDADFTLLAFCAHPMGAGDDGGATVLDAVRTRSILTRGSPPETRRWFEEFGIATAEVPLRTPDDPAAGIKTRLVLPVRHAGATLGYLWLLDGGRIDPTDLDHPALAEAVALAEEAGRRLARPEDADGDLRDLLAAALTGPPSARAGAERGLAAALGTAPQVLVALRPAGGLPPGFTPAAPGTVTASLTGTAAPVAVLLPLPDGADLRPAAAVSSAALTGLPAGSTAGLSEVRGGTAGLREQWRHAEVAAAVAAVAGHLSPVASWDELGSWRLVSELAAPDSAVVPLLAEPLLAQTAETWLDLGGSPGRTAAALCVHRQTLYYRLGRIEQLTGLDLDDGDARLLLHASLKRARLPL